MLRPAPGRVVIRPIEPADLEPLRWVVYRSYAQVLLELYGPEAAGAYEVRSPDFMATYLRREPLGCFTAAGEDGKLVGCVFCFTWGETGWFGSLGVVPERQGEGIGQALTQQALSYLLAQGCRRIGLETWPQSPLVRHLYGKFDFRPVRSTVKFSSPSAGRPPAPRAAGVHVSWLGSGSGAAAGAPAAVAATTAVVARMAAARPGEPRVDYSSEIRVALTSGWGDVLAVLDGGEPAAIALCYLKKPSGQPVSALDVRLLLVAPGARDAIVLDEVLAACDQRAQALGLHTVTCDVHLRYSRAAVLLRERGFQPVYELLRMERPVSGFDPMARSPVIHGARWAG